MSTISLSSFPNSPSVSVILVNWNCGSLIAKCLDHLFSQTLPPNRIIIVDNDSCDNSLAGIANKYNVDIHHLDKNYGFAGGNNRALTFCDTEYVALLNPDAFAAPDWLERMMHAAQANPDVAAFASLQLCEENPGIVDGVGDSYHASGLVWRDEHGANLSLVDLRCKDIFSPCAAAALYKRQALVDVGGFDEDFFCYVEDIDLGFRLRLAGRRAILVPDAIVHHVGSASTGGQRSDFCVYHGHRNLVWAFVKNMPGVLFWLFLPLHVLLNIATIGYFSIIGKGKLILQAKLDAVKGIPKMWQKRQSIQNARVATVSDIWHVLDRSLLPIGRRR